MNKKSSLRALTAAGLIGLAGVLTSQSAKSNVIIGYTVCDTNNVDVGTNLVVNTPYRVGVYLDSTPESTVGINNADWDILLPYGGGYTNYLAVTGASLPNHNTTEDFFYNLSMNSGLNRVDSTPNSLGQLDDNWRDVNGTTSGRTNAWGYLGWLNVTFTNTFTNKKFTLSAAHVTDTAGQSKAITYNNPYLNVNAIPEPTTAALYLMGVPAIVYAARRRRKELNLESETDRQVSIEARVAEAELNKRSKIRDWQQQIGRKCRRYSPSVEVALPQAA